METKLLIITSCARSVNVSLSSLKNAASARIAFAKIVSVNGLNTNSFHISKETLSRPNRNAQFVKLYTKVSLCTVIYETNLMKWSSSALSVNNRITKKRNSLTLK